MANETTSKTYSIHGLDIYTEATEGKAPVIILLHGVSMSGQIWSKQLQSKALKGHQLISIELPGHGSSSWSTAPADDYSIPGYAKVLTELIPNITNEKYILLGYSLGGNMAIEALSELNNCIGIMAVNTAIVTKPAHLEHAFHASPVLSTIFKEESDEEELNTYTHAFFSARNENMPNSLSDDFKSSDPKARSVLARSIQEGNHADEVALLKNTTIPVALVTGNNDRLGNKEYLKNLDVPKWNNTTNEIPHAGHIPQLENSEYFDAMLLSFIAHCQAVSESREAQP